MTTFFTPDYLPLKKHCDTHQKTTSAIQNVVYNKLVKFSCVATFAIVTNEYHQCKNIFLAAKRFNDVPIDEILMVGDDIRDDVIGKKCLI